MTESSHVGSVTGVRRRSVTAMALVGLLAFGGCSPPTEVLDLRNAPQATQDALQRVRIVPLGVPGPAVAGSIGPVSGYGCAPTPEAASVAAEQQIRAKAITQRATAVIDVLIEPDGTGMCLNGYNMIARGIAVGPRGIPPSY
ncbi:MAG TPA: hypothetical protein VHX39_21325 [Acetobacteraceae bacterium]|nr:hypothetical protein [Acetobacteraceae bacterium]